MTQREPVHYTVHMTDTKTGESRIIKSYRAMVQLWDFGDEYGAYSLFWWQEGNMSCDCNRHGLFYGPYSKEPCGDGRFTVRCVSDDGEVLYTDEEEV